MDYAQDYSSFALKIDSIILPVNVSDGIGKEITLNVFSGLINNNNTFYTDSNGLEMQKRVLNYRKTYNPNITEPVAGNYYPVYSAIYIEDSNRRMTYFQSHIYCDLKYRLMTEHSQGGSSLGQGKLELMLHRRILHDDNRGANEPLNETGNFMTIFLISFANDSRVLIYSRLERSWN